MTRRYNEVTISYDGGDINAITQKAEKMAFDKATLKVPENGQIISVTTDYEMNEGCITANVLLEIEMDIGNEVKIP